MMNWWWKKVGVSLKFESKNPPISLRHANSLSMTNFSAYISLLSFFYDYVTNHNSKKIQIGNYIDEILYDHDGIKMKEILLVSRIIYPLLNKVNHWRWKLIWPLPSPSHHSQLIPKTQSIKYKIIKNNILLRFMHRKYKNKK